MVMSRARISATRGSLRKRRGREVNWTAGSPEARLIPRAWVAELAYAAVSKSKSALERRSRQHAPKFVNPQHAKHFRAFDMSARLGVAERLQAPFGPAHYATCYADSAATLGLEELIRERVGLPSELSPKKAADRCLDLRWSIADVLFGFLPSSSIQGVDMNERLFRGNQPIPTLAITCREVRPDCSIHAFAFAPATNGGISLIPTRGAC
jgi:hypothetical protein